ncbi:uncharacterized protein TRAVEDRAFT_29586 [Trametes versicolor FP-101664 SS1]|uniref:uncharacterized protein n=1 Tax=Trametes versicolor (strain FP-101664) TaxID=717944 RepID=UPI00046214E2|nr:uncharacterized protein TRAVEDRAFT_29586 [Trametes versicolor FP-101664 SS1]EIW57516.1 hypothetical protein TRAVEDRAFT_29586 [Trametes versicolor FP-101664 SS1]
MFPSLLTSVAFVAALASGASAHVSIWHPSMYGFNVTDSTFSYDNRPQVPLYNMPFSQWWFHGHIDYPPNEGDFFELEAGGTVNTVLSCDKGATIYYNSSQGGDVGYGSDSPCVGAPTSAYHTTGIDDVKGCALAIAYKSDVHDVQPDDFTIFSVNHTCVWYQNTAFDVPSLPACPEGGCHCAWFWIHSIDSGAEQIYMNAFKCKVTGDVGTQPLGKPALPRRCGPDPDNGLPDARPENCTLNAKLPMYWYQQDGNNMFEDTYHAPYYNDLYGFHDGAQNDIFADGVIASLAGSANTYTAASSTHTTAQATTTAQAPPATTEAPASPTTTQADPTTAAPPTSEQAEPTTVLPSTTIPSEAPTSIVVAPVVTSEATTSTEPTASASRRCKPRTTESAQAKKRNHSRHLAGRHAH